MNKKKKHIIITICVLMLLSLTSYGIYTVFFNDNFSDNRDISKTPDDPFANLPNATKRTTILLVGVDERKGDSGRTDTILLATVDPERNKISFISIPRDTRVLVPGRRYYSKINAAYAFGGIQKTRETIENLLGIKIDYHIKTNFNGFVQVIDILGGVELNVEKRMKYTDRAGGLYIDLKPGLQKLDGEKAIQYVRFRHDANGSDTARIARQQKFMQAVTEQCLKPSTILRIPQLLKEVSENIETDMSTLKIIQLARFAKQIGKEGIQTPSILPGEPRYVGRVSYYLPDYEKTQVLLAYLVYGQKLSEGDKKILLARKKYIDSLNTINSKTETKPVTQTKKQQQPTQETTIPVASEPPVIRTDEDDIPYENSPDEGEQTNIPQPPLTTTQPNENTQTQVPPTNNTNNNQNTSNQQLNNQNNTPVQQEETEQNTEPTSSPAKTTTQPSENTTTPPQNTNTNTTANNQTTVAPRTQTPPMQ